MKVYIVFRFNVHTYPEVVGVFDDEAKAVAACKSPMYSVGPLVMNEVTPEDATEWPGLHCPIDEEVKA